MPDLRSVVAAVSRNATRIIALSVLIGLAFPSAAAAVRPWLPQLVVLLLTAALLRVDFGLFVQRLRRPARALAASLWLTLATPILFLSAARVLGLDAIDPAVLTIVFLFSATSPIVSTPTFAAMMGLDVALSLAVLLFALAAMPLFAPIMAEIFVEPDLPITVLDLARRLAILIGAGFAITLVLRRLAGRERIAQAAPLVDCFAIVLVVLFAIASMDGIRAEIVADPGKILVILAACYLVAFLNLGLTYAVFRPFVGADAVAIAYAAGNRNMGVMVSALGVYAIPDLVWLFFALSQLPIFTLPFLLKGVGQRLVADAAPADASRPAP